MVIKGVASDQPGRYRQIELGFPQALYEKEMVRRIRSGGVWDRLLL
jgi:hypothetical protein